VRLLAALHFRVKNLGYCATSPGRRDFPDVAFLCQLFLAPWALLLTVVDHLY